MCRKTPQFLRKGFSKFTIAESKIYISQSLRNIDSDEFTEFEVFKRYIRGGCLLGVLCKTNAVCHCLSLFKTKNFPSWRGKNRNFTLEYTNTVSIFG